MKFLIAFAAIFLTTCIFECSSHPPTHPIEKKSAVDEVVLSRVRRFTCDVLSFEVGSVKLNHAACAAHCLSLKKSGGYCNANQVCVCR